jgi:hypothetical protein
MSAKVFISYRRDDSAGHAGRVRDRLEREFGHDLLFMDVDAIPLGVNFIKVLREEVARCDVLLAVIGPNWLDARDEEGNRRLDNPSDFLRIEVATALQRDIPVIPILLDGAKIPKADQLPEDRQELALRNALDVRHASFHSDMDKLIRGLKGPAKKHWFWRERHAEVRAPTAAQSPPEKHAKPSVKAEQSTAETEQHRRPQTEPAEDEPPISPAAKLKHYAGIGLELASALAGTVIGVICAFTFLMPLAVLSVQLLGLALFHGPIFIAAPFLMIVLVMVVRYSHKSLLNMRGWFSFGIVASFMTWFCLLIAAIHARVFSQRNLGEPGTATEWLIGYSFFGVSLIAFLILRLRHKRVPPPG